MKISFLRSSLLTLIIAAFGFARPLFGQDTTDMLSKALDLVHQVETPAGNPPSDAQRIDLLAQAITAAQAAPNHRLKGHRVLAIQAIRSAIAEIREGDPNHQAAIYLHTADTELSTSISLAGTVETPDATTTNPASITNVTATTPPASISPAPSDTMRHAVENGDLGKVKALLQENPGLVFSKDKDGETPLLQASSAGHLDIAELLLANKADVHAKDKTGQTPLHFAAMGDLDSINMAKLLLANGADIQARDDEGNTPLLVAASEGNKNMAEFLLTKGADIEAKDNSGCTPLIWAAIQGHRDVAAVLLAHKADVNARSPSSGQTALSSAAMNGHKDVAELLLTNHAALQGLDQCGQTPLDWAVDNGHLEMVEFLLAQGADVNAKAKNGSTPLHLAELAHNYDIANLLLQRGGREPDGTAPTKPFPTADASTDPATFDAAIRAGDLSKVKALVQANPKIVAPSGDGEFSPFVAAAANGRKEIVEFLLSNHADINSKNEMDDTALSCAATRNDMELAKFLLSHGAEVNTRNKFGYTPLYEAMSAIPWRSDMSTLLLAHGADPNIGDNDGSTPLHHASTWIRADKAEFLLGYKIDVNAKDKRGDTPLYVALSAGARDDIAQVLLEHGADPMIKGHDGLTPRDLAQKAGDTEMARVLADPAGTLGPPPVPSDGISPQDAASRFAADLAKIPPGPVEGEVTKETLDAFEGLAKMTGVSKSVRQGLVEGYHKFTLHGPVITVYAQGLAAICEGRATLTPAALDEYKQDAADNNNSVSLTTPGGNVPSDQGSAGMVFGPGISDYVDSQVPLDGEVTVNFCLVQQQGHWRVHCLYFSKGPLTGGGKDFIVKQLAAYSRRQ
jgi:ankyrin repeat protein